MTIFAWRPTDPMFSLRVQCGHHSARHEALTIMMCGEAKERSGRGLSNEKLQPPIGSCRLVFLLDLALSHSWIAANIGPLSTLQYHLYCWLEFRKNA
jgi:hypothetical protein